jgi:FKBP-type peptidyl-prolyl cis-trans isomerase FkpA
MNHKLLFLLLLFSFTGCGLPEYSEESKARLIGSAEDYAKKHPLDFEKMDSGLLYHIKNPDKGEHPAATDTVLVHYKGMLTNGEVFDKTMGGAPVSIALNEAIDGWKQGIPMLKRKGRGTFIIPPHLGYGDKRVGKIPNDAILVFEIYLIDF